MANSNHLKIINQGVVVWNKWRKDNPGIQPDLSGANFERTDLCVGPSVVLDFSTANLEAAKFTRAELERVNFSGSNLRKANFRQAGAIVAKYDKADLRSATFYDADLECAKFHEANLQNADLSYAKLWGTDFRSANLSKSTLVGAQLIETDLRNANISFCDVYGVSVWSVELDGCIQKDLNINRTDFPSLKLDSMEIAQFISLVLINKKLRNVIDSITTKVVLILGRFTPERKPVLDEMRESLQELGFVPVILDFDKPTTRDLTETVSLIAHMAKFVIADLTSARSIPQELSHIIPNLPSVPVVPLFCDKSDDTEPYGMFEHFKKYPWVLPIIQYSTAEDLCNNIRDTIVGPAEKISCRTIG